MAGVGEKPPHAPLAPLPLVERRCDLPGGTVIGLDQLADVRHAAERNRVRREVAAREAAQFRGDGDQRRHRLRGNPARDEPRRNQCEQQYRNEDREELPRPRFEHHPIGHDGDFRSADAHEFAVHPRKRRKGAIRAGVNRSIGKSRNARRTRVAWSARVTRRRTEAAARPARTHHEDPHVGSRDERAHALRQHVRRDLGRRRDVAACFACDKRDRIADRTDGRVEGNPGQHDRHEADEGADDHRIRDRQAPPQRRHRESLRIE